MSATTAGPGPTQEQRAQVDFDAVLAGIARAQAETRKFSAEQNKLAEKALKLARGRTLAPWQVVAATVAATATLLGASAAVAALVARWVAAG